MFKSFESSWLCRLHQLVKIIRQLFFWWNFIAGANVPDLDIVYKKLQIGRSKSHGVAIVTSNLFQVFVHAFLFGQLVFSDAVPIPLPSCRMAPVSDPAQIEGIDSWTIEMRGHRGRVFAVKYSPTGKRPTLSARQLQGWQALRSMVNRRDKS